MVSALVFKTKHYVADETTAEQETWRLAVYEGFSQSACFACRQQWKRDCVREGVKNHCWRIRDIRVRIRLACLRWTGPRADQRWHWFGRARVVGSFLRSPETVRKRRHTTSSPSESCRDVVDTSTETGQSSIVMSCPETGREIDRSPPLNPLKRSVCRTLDQGQNEHLLTRSESDGKNEYMVTENKIIDTSQPTVRFIRR